MTVYYITDFLYSLSSLTKDAQDSNLSLISKFINYNIYKMPYNDTLIPVYHCHKPVFRPKMAIFRRAGMREGGFPLTLAFHYLIFMILRACDLNLVTISLLASKCQDFKLRGL